MKIYLVMYAVAAVFLFGAAFVPAGFDIVLFAIGLFIFGYATLGALQDRRDRRADAQRR